MGLQPLYGKGPRLLLWAVSRAAHGNITISGTPNLPNDCVIFIVYAQFTNASAGCRLETHDFSHTCGHITLSQSFKVEQVTQFH
jgi:hypothetical protein